MELYPHQEKLLQQLTDHPQWGVFWECRTMKTFPMILHITNLLLSNEIEDALIIAPKSALGAWKRDMEVLKGKRKDVCQKITLINYQKVWRREEYDRPYGAVVLDESHNIAGRRSIQSKFCMKYSKRSKYRYLLSGTAIGQGRLEDLYNQMEFLQPDFFGKWSKFEARYCVTKQLPNTFVKLVVGYRNKEELLEKVGTMVSTLRLKDVIDLPKEMAHNIIRLDKPSPKIMSHIKKGYVEKYDIAIMTPAVKMMKMRQVSSGFIIDEKGVAHTLNTHKRDALLELLDEVLPEKLIIFCEFTHSINMAREALRYREVSHIVLDGKQMDKECWRRFQANEHIKVMVCQYGSANAGIDLYTAHHMVFFEPTLSTTMNEQSQARITGAQQKHPCMYHWLLAQDSIEEKIHETLAKQRDFTLKVFEQWSIV